MVPPGDDGSPWRQEATATQRPCHVCDMRAFSTAQ